MATMGREESVFMGSDGAIYHAPCWQALEYHGVRGRREIAFYCPGCVQHVTLPMHRLAAIPMRDRRRAEADHGALFTPSPVGVGPRA